MNESIQTIPFTELNEDELLGPRIHTLCCNSSYIALCGKECKGKKRPYTTATTCAVCIEITEEHPCRPCYENVDLCIRKGKDNRRDDK